MSTDELTPLIGDVPHSRIRTDPVPGTATEADVERILRDEDRICELIDGVLVEKAVSDETAILAMEIGRLLGNFVVPRRLGWVLGPDGFTRLFGRQLRAPDVSFARRDQRPDNRPLRSGYAEDVPVLAVEVFSPGNTVREIEQKRDEFFAAGTELFWVVYPDREEIEVFVSPEAHRLLGRDDMLDGGQVLPEFAVPVADIFAALDLARGGSDT